MEKTLRISLLIILMIVLLFSVTGCKRKEKEDSKIDKSKSLTYNALSKVQDDYFIALETGEEDDKTWFVMAKKGDKEYLDTETKSQHTTYIYKNKKTYVVSHDKQIYKAFDGKSESIFSSVPLFTEELNEIESLEYISGSETIDKVEYKYEEYKNGDTGAERFYFLDNELKYFKTISEDGTEILTKVEKISSDVDKDFFEIPKEYEEVEELDIEI